ncbi:MAG TPA: hypothetical protein PL078_05885 [Bacillota bacterium]|nr:hypothetical protein [Peptococcaceae bacterium MAG4]NLW38201.1 hypothetical protein [Peptococcaceae bacterium]HPZ43518.1 hypothetical protein [Bacillota bacterium]HQD76344.1 hypothetical protein [Bacillota bacterium]HUM58261.1 hypothetical protein [Bacillota bacterium]
MFGQPGELTPPEQRTTLAGELPPGSAPVPPWSCILDLVTTFLVFWR